MATNSVLTKIGFFFLLSFNIAIGHSQEAMFQNQSIMKLEFLNPAYNSFRDYSSISIVNREQWKGNLVGNPEIYAASIYLPIRYSRIGIGLITVAERIGLRDKMSFLATITHNVQIGSESFLAFGYGLGLENTSYNLNRMIILYDYLDVNSVDLNYHRTNVVLGLFYYSSGYYVGLSSNNLIENERNSGEWLLPGFDFAVGAMYKLRKGIMLRPEVELKHYSVTSIDYNDGVKEKSSFNSLLEVSLSALFSNRMWLGTSHRFENAHTFSFDLVIKEKLKLGYTYEIGVGEGFRQFNSQIFRLNWSFINNKARTGFDRKRRYSVAKSYLYK